jgi:osmotically-inducible protein OsmY
VADATKDFAGVTAAVNDGIVTLTGTIKKADLPKLMQSVSSLKPKKIENKLTVN